jgi:hypothetical protein
VDRRASTSRIEGRLATHARSWHHAAHAARVDPIAERLAGLLELREVLVFGAQFVVGRHQVGLAIRVVASEPPLLCGSAGTQVAIVSP